MARWPGGQVARWSGGQVVRWPGGQVVRWSGWYVHLEGEVDEGGVEAKGPEGRGHQQDLDGSAPAKCLMKYPNARFSCWLQEICNLQPFPSRKLT